MYPQLLQDLFHQQSHQSLKPGQHEFVRQSYHNSVGKDRLPTTIFQGLLLLNFGGVQLNGIPKGKIGDAFIRVFPFFF